MKKSAAAIKQEAIVNLFAVARMAEFVMKTSDSVNAHLDG